MDQGRTPGMSSLEGIMLGISKLSGEKYLRILQSCELIAARVGVVCVVAGKIGM